MKLFTRLCAFCLIALTYLSLSFGSAEAAPASKLDQIIARGYILVGSTGDYKPMSYYNKATDKYEGFDVAMAEDLAKSLGVKVKWVHTTWPKLMQDTLDGKFDIAICGISRNAARAQKAALSQGYVVNGKTVLMRSTDVAKYPTLASMDQSSVTVMVNPGGSNQKFANANFKHAKIVVHNQNAEIPGLVAKGKADIMITETVEANKYIKEEPRLAAPLVNTPFTRSEFGILLQRGDQIFLNYINFWMDDVKLTGQMTQWEREYFN